MPLESNLMPFDGGQESGPLYVGLEPYLEDVALCLRRLDPLEEHGSLDHFFRRWRPQGRRNNENPELWYLTALYMIRIGADLVAELALERMLSLGTQRPHHLAKAASFFGQLGREGISRELWNLMEQRAGQPGYERVLHGKSCA